MFNPESEASVSSAVNVVVVEDQESEFDYIRPMLERYFNDIDREFRLVHHRDAKSFLASYQKGTDIILMDIELGEKSGMEAAQEIRRIDEDVVIIFCTKMAQFAVEGYQVNALDFLVKPFRYEGLAFRLNRAMKVLDRGRRFLLVKTKDGSQNLQLDDILYLDVFGSAHAVSCAHPNHPHGEREDLANRRAVFQYAKELMGSVATEQQPNDFCVDIVDLGAFGPISAEPWVSLGIPVLPIPLWQLVYHDAILNYTAESSAYGSYGDEYMAYVALYCMLPTALICTVSRWRFLSVPSTTMAALWATAGGRAMLPIFSRQS